eukprot:SAG22_NODE_3570_length_1636_cov_3.327912_1_plen_231_part_00
MCDWFSLTLLFSLTLDTYSYGSLTLALICTLGARMCIPISHGPPNLSVSLALLASLRLGPAINTTAACGTVRGPGHVACPMSSCSVPNSLTHWNTRSRTTRSNSRLCTPVRALSASGTTSSAGRIARACPARPLRLHSATRRRRLSPPPRPQPCGSVDFRLLPLCLLHEGTGRLKPLIDVQRLFISIVCHFVVRLDVDARARSGSDATAPDESRRSIQIYNIILAVANFF